MANVTISDIRKKYPDYNDLSDQDLADKLHAKFYSDMPRDEFYSKIGFDQKSKPSLATKIFMPFDKNTSGYSPDPVTSSVFGATDALHNQAANVANIMPGVNIPMAHHGEGTAYNIGDFVGNAMGYTGAGEALGGIKALGFLGSSPMAGVARRVLGSAAYGATQSPGERTTGALEGGALGSLAEAIPAVGSNIIKAFQPQKHLDALLEKISGGKNLQENAKILAKMLKSGFKGSLQKASELYDPLIEHSPFRNSSIYRTVNPSGYHAYLEKEIPLIEDANGYLGKIQDTFKRNPSLANAHDFQSQLGAEAAKTRGSDLAAGNLKKLYANTRQEVRDDMYNFLEREQRGLGDKYEEATNEYKTHVVPYKENDLIQKIVKSKITNPSNISHVFKNPEPGIEKILSDLGNEGKDRILAAAINKQKGQIKPERFLKSVEDITNKGIELSPDTDELVKQLESKTRNRDLFHRASTMLMASQIGRALGLPAGGEVGGLLGALKGTDIVQGLEPYSRPILNSGIPNALKKSYRPAYQSIIANTVGS